MQMRHHTSPSSATAPVTVQPLLEARNPFLPIPWGYRLLLIAYLLVYRILDPALDFIAVGGDVAVGSHVALEIGYNTLLFLPIIFYRSTYGWLHPLIFPMLFSLAGSFARNPGQFFSIFFVPLSPLDYDVTNAALRGWSPETVAWAEVYGEAINILALTLYYIGFFYGPRLPIPTLRFSKPRNVMLKALVAIGAAFLVFAVYMQIQGGITGHLNSLYTEGAGRYLSIKRVRALGVLVRVGTIVWVIWLALDRKAHLNPLFWISGLMGMLFNFISSGTRSSAIFFAITALIVWMLKTQRFPKAKVLAMGVVSVLLVNVLGQVRASAWHGNFNYSGVLEEVSEAGFLNTLRRGSEEMATRSETSHGYLPIIANVPGNVDFLYGESYIHVIAAPIPRVLWPNKPRSIDAYVGTRLFGYDAISIPPSAVGEAYWNFHIPGVIIVMLLFGMLHRWLARTYWRYAQVPAATALYALTLFWFWPTSTAMVSYLHTIVPAIAVLYFMGALTWKRHFLARAWGGARQVL